ncbi:MAG: tetratricopeptide repeat protein, partial [Armatimonadetes bacterium]|nr:tetratricopeptide repeat protein [Armatimonadota bacterium]
LCRRALEIWRKALGEAHPSYATSLNNLASLYQDIGRCEKAEPLYRQAMEILGKVDGEDHPHYASSLNNLAALYHDMGRCEEAEPV